MDSRKTLVVTETFKQMLLDLYHAKTRAALLFDDNGLTRAEDFVAEFREDGKDSYIKLENGLEIPVKTIIAVNGTFLSEYSEC